MAHQALKAHINYEIGLAALRKMHKFGKWTESPIWRDKTEESVCAIFTLYINKDEKSLEILSKSETAGDEVKKYAQKALEMIRGQKQKEFGKFK